MGKRRRNAGHSTEKTNQTPTQNLFLSPHDSSLPVLIHSTTFETLKKTMLKTMPADRNIFITMKMYKMSNINPCHEVSPEAPTHVIVFCIRLLRKGYFQPIGGLLTYEDEDHSEVIAECLKAYVNDLYLLRLYVVGTVSSTDVVFKKVLAHLTKTENCHTRSGPLTYSVAPYGNIVHLYDVNQIVHEFQNQFIKVGVIEFTMDNESHILNWSDVLITFGTYKKPAFVDMTARLREIPWDALDVRFDLEFKKCIEKGLITSTKEARRVFNNTQSFLKLLKLDNMSVLQFRKICDCWKEYQIILESMKFGKSEDKQIQNDFKDDTPIELEEKCMNKIMNSIDRSINMSAGVERPNCEAKSTSCSDEKEKTEELSKESRKREKVKKLKKKTEFDTINGEDVDKPTLAGVLLKYLCSEENNNEAQNIRSRNGAIRKTYLDQQRLKPMDVETEVKNMEALIDRIITFKSKPSAKENQICDKKRHIREEEANAAIKISNCDKLSDIDQRSNETLLRDWLCTIRGLDVFADKLFERKMRSICPSLMSLEHIDFFVHLIMKMKNNMRRVVYNGSYYNFLDYDCAFSTLDNETGLYLIKK